MTFKRYKDVDQGKSAYPVGIRPWVLAPRKEVLMGGGREGGGEGKRDERRSREREEFKNSF